MPTDQFDQTDPTKINSDTAAAGNFPSADAQPAASPAAPGAIPELTDRQPANVIPQPDDDTGKVEDPFDRTSTIPGAPTGANNDSTMPATPEQIVVNPPTGNAEDAAPGLENTLGEEETAPPADKTAAPLAPPAAPTPVETPAPNPMAPADGQPFLPQNPTSMSTSPTPTNDAPSAVGDAGTTNIPVNNDGVGTTQADDPQADQGLNDMFPQRKTGQDAQTPQPTVANPNGRIYTGEEPAPGFAPDQNNPQQDDTDANNQDTVVAGGAAANPSADVPVFPANSQTPLPTAPPTDQEQD